MYKRYPFPKALRLFQKSLFSNVLAMAQPLRGTYYRLYYLRNALGYSRLGIAVSKKNARLAVARNRIKRQARESFRYHQTELAGYDIILMARRSAAEADQHGLRQCLDQLFKELAGLSH